MRHAQRHQTPSRIAVLSPRRVRNQVAAAVMLALAATAVGLSTPGQATVDPASAVTQAPITGPRSFADVAERVTPAVVNVTVTQRIRKTSARTSHGLPEFPDHMPFGEFFRHFKQHPGFSMPHQTEAQGSGFLVDASGLIVTNNHVIDGADKVQVTLNDGSQYEARVKGRDSKTDLALIKIDADKPLPFVELADTGNARVGDWVLAVGNPFGLGGSVNAGIISARGRDIHSGPYDDYLQIDAPINRGNSGGPLFDAAGRVIGVNTAIYSPSGGNVGIGFAIPAETVRDVVAELREHGQVTRGWLGVQIQPVTDEIAAGLGLGKTTGILVADVIADTPAARAGIQAGDVILSAAGQTMDDYKALTKLVAATDAGSTMALQIHRSGKVQDINVKIGPMPNDDDVAVAPVSDDTNDGQPRIGLYLAPLTPDVRKQQGIDTDSQGVLVAKVEPGSPAEEAGIRAGSLITMVGSTPVDSPEQVVAEVRAAAEQERPAVLLRIEHEGKLAFIAVPFAT